MSDEIIANVPGTLLVEIYDALGAACETVEQLLLDLEPDTKNRQILNDHYSSEKLRLMGLCAHINQTFNIDILRAEVES